MIEVTFSDSTKASLVAAKMQDVVQIGFALDVGDISGEYDGPGRQEVVARMWERFGFDEQEQAVFMDGRRTDMEKILTAAQSGKQIRIWKSDNPYSICGLYFIAYILRNIDCEMSVIALPEYTQVSEEEVASYSGWAEVEADKIPQFLPLERPITIAEKLVLGRRWSELMEENAPLRALVNGRLVSVTEDFYDHIIIKNIPEESFYMPRLIGELLGKYYLGISDSWYALRIDKMIAERKLMVLRHDESHPYGKVLKRV